MIGGKGGLTVKDYPFAFSIAALVFPQILQGGNDLAPILTITLVGGMLGSLLIIINPVGLAIREVYLRTKQQDVYPKLNQQNNLAKQILKKNFRAALSAPAISYENDKIVGMMYFVTVLGFALYRTIQQDFVTALELTEEAIWGMRIGVGIGLVSVLLVLRYNIWGFIIKKSKKSISHLDRIRTVTISNLAVDFANLSNEGGRWQRYTTGDIEIRRMICKGLLKVEEESPILILKEHFLKAFPVQQVKNEYTRRRQSWKDNLNLDLLYTTYRSAKEVSLRYDTKLSETLTWFNDMSFLAPTEFDEPISQLQNSIESRDWYNAILKTYRITDRLEDFLEAKNMPAQITT